MPRGDRTGPMGMGPMTGRGAGYCGGFGAQVLQTQSREEAVWDSDEDTAEDLAWVWDGGMVGHFKVLSLPLNRFSTSRSMSFRCSKIRPNTLARLCSPLTVESLNSKQRLSE